MELRSARPRTSAKRSSGSRSSPAAGSRCGRGCRWVRLSQRISISRRYSLLVRTLGAYRFPLCGARDDPRVRSASCSRPRCGAEELSDARRAPGRREWLGLSVDAAATMWRAPGTSISCAPREDNMRAVLDWAHEQTPYAGSELRPCSEHSGSFAIRRRGRSWSARLLERAPRVRSRSFSSRAFGRSAECSTSPVAGVERHRTTRQSLEISASRGRTKQTLHI